MNILTATLAENLNERGQSMTLQQLKYVVTTAKCGSITAAANELFIAQPSLTKAISDLEKEIGIVIFNRQSRGVTVSKDGEIFLGYARGVLEQTALIEEKYMGKDSTKQEFAVSTQHYSFAVNAFVNLIKKYAGKTYDLSLRETETYEIINDVSRLRSEIGILYLNDFNEDVIKKILKVQGLSFTELFVAKPHVFVSNKNPVSKRNSVTFKDLEPYPYLSFEQGEHNAFYFSEEIFSTEVRSKNIRVRDRATLFNLLIGLNGYTVCSGIIDENLNGKNIVAVPLEAEGNMHIGYIKPYRSQLTKLGKAYVEELTALLSVAN